MGLIPIRLAKASDADTIAVMSRDLIEIGLGWSWSPERVRRSVQNRDTLALVAGRGRAVGFCLTEFGDRSGHLSLLAVLPQARRRGIGRCMVEWMLESARCAGLCLVRVEMRAGNDRARKFYAALGFVEREVIAGYYRGIESALRMELLLSAPDPKPVQWEIPAAWRGAARSD